MDKIIKLNKDFTCNWKGETIKWFIGDVNASRAIKIGQGKRTQSGGVSIKNIWNNKKGYFWEAWGSFNGKAYQLSAWCAREKVADEEVFYLKDISVPPPRLDSPYYDEENHRTLTQLSQQP